MSRDEREAFLAAPRIGVLSLQDDGRGPLTVPVWYAYEPGGDVWFVTDRDSRKGRLLAEGTRVSLCVQTEQAPYSYVSIEGPVTRIAASDVEDDLRPMARRYLGTRAGDGYADSAAAAGRSGSIRVEMRPERWLTVDYAKRG